MNPLLQKSGGDWIGWAGDNGGDDGEDRRAILRDLAESELF